MRVFSFAGKYEIKDDSGNTRFVGTKESAVGYLADSFDTINSMKRIIRDLCIAIEASELVQPYAKGIWVSPTTQAAYDEAKKLLGTTNGETP